MPETDCKAIIRNCRHSLPAMEPNGSSREPGKSSHPEPVEALPVYSCNTVTCFLVQATEPLTLNFTPQPPLPSGKRHPTHNQQKAGLAPGPVWAGYRRQNTLPPHRVSKSKRSSHVARGNSNYTIPAPNSPNFTGHRMFTATSVAVERNFM